MPAPSLVAMAQRCAQRNASGIEDVSDLPYPLIEPILRKIRNATQLRKIEENSPQIVGVDAELWIDIIKRDIPNWQAVIIYPNDPANWWKVYRKLKKELDKAAMESEKMLLAAFQGIEKKKEATKTQFIDKVIPQRGSSQHFVNGVLRTTKTHKPTLKNSRTGADMINAIRKQSATATQQRGAHLVKQPARALLQSAKNQIKEAPRAMVRDHAKTASPAQLALVARAQKEREHAAAPTSSTTTIFAPRGEYTHTEKALARAMAAQQTERENRLRALTTPGVRTTSTSASPAVSTSTSKAESIPRQHTTSARSTPSPRKGSFPIPERGLSSPPTTIKRKRSDVEVFAPTKRNRP